ncbi:MFS transporter [Novosphingobium aerophilum]|uniref:MFS transporter n=1 Tax=Novosphingobium aerophilum TaxID=2839843 RepID=UPI003FD34436
MVQGVIVGSHSFRDRLVLPAVAVASLALLQPGIDPVFLTLLTAAHHVSPESHGWIVGATQGGMALGSVTAWVFGRDMPGRLFVLAALGAFVAGLATVNVGAAMPLMAIRAGYGMAMGLLYTHAMASAAQNRPSGAYGAVFLVQLVISTVVAVLLPIVSDMLGPRMALMTLCLAPLAVLAAFLLFPAALGGAAVPGSSPARCPAAPAGEERQPVGMQGWLYAASALAFICATMMVWSFTGALAIEWRISEDVVGRAVAMGSIAGAATALAVMREKPVVPPVVSGLVAGAMLLAPIAGARGGDMAFVLAIVLFNLGSTAIIVRTSGLASGASEDRLFRRFVTCTHSLGMIAGPVLGGIATWLMGALGLPVMAALAIVAGCLALGIAGFRAGFSRDDAVQHDEPQNDLALAVSFG